MNTDDSANTHLPTNKNINILGWQMHNPVFFVSASVSILAVTLALLFTEQANVMLSAALDWLLKNFSWLFVSAPLFTIFALFALALSPFGKVRLGRPDDRPEFGFLSWLAMLFAAGVSVGYMFYGAAEPLSYYTGFAGPPLNAEPLTEEARTLAFSATLYHWGFMAWGVYAASALTLAYFAYVKGFPLTVRTILYPFIGNRIWGPIGHTIDIAAVTATLLGLATSIGIGATQAASGLGHIVGFSSSITWVVILIGFVTFLAIISIARGVEGGIKVLSNINMVVAFLLMLFVIYIGPGLDIFQLTFTNLKNHFIDMPRLTVWWGREDKEFFFDWTIFYLAWWTAWTPFVGMFIARISRGRTIREFVLAVMLAPLLLSGFWFSAFGSTSIMQFENGLGEFAGGVTDISLVLFQLLDTLPFSEITAAVALMLLIVFLTTSADSGALVVDNITAGGRTDSNVAQRIFWAIMVGVVTSVIILIDGGNAIRALQAGTLIAALPFAILVVLGCIGLIKSLIKDHRSNAGK